MGVSLFRQADWLLTLALMPGPVAGAAGGRKGPRGVPTVDNVDGVRNFKGLAVGLYRVLGFW